jgi:hypothetical protein
MKKAVRFFQMTLVLILFHPGASSAATFSLGFGIPSNPAPSPVDVSALPGISLTSGMTFAITVTGRVTQTYRLAPGSPQQGPITTNPNGLTDTNNPQSFVIPSGFSAFAPIGSIWGLFTTAPLDTSSLAANGGSISIGTPDFSPGTKAPRLWQGFFIGTGLDTNGQQKLFAVPTAATHFYVGQWIEGDNSASDAGTYAVNVSVASSPVAPTTPLPPPPTVQTVFTASSGLIPPAVVQVNASGTYGNATLSVALDIVDVLQAVPVTGFAASTYNVYVVALVPGAVLGLTSPVIFTKSSVGWGPLQFPVAPYLTNAAQYAVNNQVIINILASNDITSLVGTEIYIGYGLSDTEMLVAGRYRGVYKVQ